MRNIVEFQVEEDVEAELLERLHNLRTLGIIQRHADFEPFRMAAQLHGKAKRSSRIAVERDDHAAYLANWIRVLKADSKAFVTAASAAQKAADLILASAAEAAPEGEAEPEGEAAAMAA